MTAIPNQAGPSEAGLTGRETAGQRSRLFKEGAFNSAGILCSALVGIFIVPILYRGLGAQMYGVWIASVAVSTTAEFLDFGLGSVVTREVAVRLGAPTGGRPESFFPFLHSVYLVFGLIGAGAITLTGIILVPKMRLPAEYRSLATGVFALCGVAFIARQFFLAGVATLGGMRRFDLLSWVTSGQAVLRAVGFILVLAQGIGIVGIAVWEIIALVITAWTTSGLVARVAPDLHFRSGRVRWASLRSFLPFGLGSQLVSALSASTWQIMPILIGVFQSPGLVAPFYVAQKFPLAVSGLSDRLSVPFFPAASEYQRSENRSASKETLKVGVRWVMVITIPFFIVLWAGARPLLNVWLGWSTEDMVVVLRITTAAVFFQAAGGAALQVLWGRGHVRRAALVLGVTITAMIGTALILVPEFGIKGAGWSLLWLIPGNLIMLISASQSVALHFIQLVRGVFGGLLLPALCACLVAAPFSIWMAPRSWAGIGLMSSLVLAAYGSALLLTGGGHEERLLLHSEMSSLMARIRAACAEISRLLRGLPGVRSNWYLWLAAKGALREFSSDAREFDDSYAECRDPWGYESDWGKRHLAVTQELLGVAGQESRIQSALEIGCGEGRITELLGGRCDSVLAVDFSAIAVEKAGKRCEKWSNIRFAKWDLLRESKLGVFDLVLAMGVIELFHSPRTLTLVCKKVADMMAPDGYLLASFARQHSVYEKAWWGRYLPRGARPLADFVARHGGLTPCIVKETESHVFVLFRKKPDSESTVQAV